MIKYFYNHYLKDSLSNHLLIKSLNRYKFNIIYIFKNISFIQLKLNLIYIKKI